MFDSIKILSLVVLCPVLISNSTHAQEDIKLSELETACEHLEAMEKYMDEAIEINKSYEKENLSVDDLSEKDLKRLTIIGRKINEIDDTAQKKFSREEAMDCPNFEDVLEKNKKLRK